MPNPHHYSDSSATFPQSHHGFTSNALNASTPAGRSDLPQHRYILQRQHPAFNQHQQSYEPDAAYSSYARPSYPQSSNAGYVHQPLQMPDAPADSRYARNYELPLPRDQPQFQQVSGYPETYPQYGYPATNIQSAHATSYPPGGSGGYPPPGSTALAEAQHQTYVNRTYPPPGTHSSNTQYPPEVHRNGQMTAVTDRPIPNSRDDAGSHPHSQQYGVTRNAVLQTEPAGNPSSTASRQEPTNTEQHQVWSADSTSRQSKNHNSSNIANNRQTSQQKNPHIVKAAVLNPAATGKLLCLLSLTMTLFEFMISHMFSS